MYVNLLYGHGYQAVIIGVFKELAQQEVFNCGYGRCIFRKALDLFYKKAAGMTCQFCKRQRLVIYFKSGYKEANEQMEVER